MLPVCVCTCMCAQCKCVYNFMCVHVCSIHICCMCVHVCMRCVCVPSVCMCMCPCVDCVGVQLYPENKFIMCSLCAM